MKRKKKAYKKRDEKEKKKEREKASEIEMVGKRLWKTFKRSIKGRKNLKKESEEVI